MIMIRSRSRIRRVEEFRTLETDRELSYISSAMGLIKEPRSSSVVRMHVACHKKHY